MCSVQHVCRCAVCNMQSAVGTMQYAVRSMQYAVCSMLCMVRGMQHIQCMECSMQRDCYVIAMEHGVWDTIAI